ncbi:MAG: class A beta-lactamase [Methyloceanibacter sp.]|uniref:class A beta-lactamase n=1 Tax=Methyloceanibacter sp. TaxID=1965321 RepID=UPI003D6CF52C
MMTRRQLGQGLGAAVLLLGSNRLARATIDGGGAFGWLGDEFARIETESGGRLGVAALDTHTGQRAGHRADERFPICSTFKLLASAAILARVDAGQESLDREVAIRKEDIVTYAPVTEKHVGGSMPLARVCEAAVTLSDNTAGNLLLAALGGPGALTSYARSLGDEVTRLDRIELALNEAAPGDPRDTTTPAAMAGDLHALLVGNALTPRSRDQLTAWLIASKTGAARLRAGFPAGWRIGDKTGTCNDFTAGDVGIAWPPQGAPVIIAAYLKETEAPPKRRDETFAAVARAIAPALKG